MRQGKSAGRRDLIHTAVNEGQGGGEEKSSRSLEAWREGITTFHPTPPFKGYNCQSSLRS